MLKLRDYQEKAIQDLFSYWEEGKGTSPCVVLPTGSGKSLLISSFCERVCRESPEVRIMVVVHSRELVQQNHDELKANWPDAYTSIYSAGLKSKNANGQIIFAGIQSVYNKVFDCPKIDIVIIDEAHCIPRNADTRYGRFLKDLKLSNPDVAIWGTTATPFRLDSGLLTEGDHKLFDGIAHCTDIKTLIEKGYLVPIISKGGVMKINLDGVHLRAGDYAANELARAADDPELIRRAVEEFVEYGKDRRAWLIYCAGIVHAEHVALEVKKHGIECKVLTGDTPLEERDKIISEFRSGKLRCISNVGVLLTGFNAPITDMIVLLFSTTSTGKYVQVVGRGARTYPDKNDCLLMDYGGNCAAHGVLDEIDPIKRKNVFCVEKAPPPMRECPKCRSIFHARIFVCPSCGFEFELPEATANHGCEAYSGAVLASQQQPFFVDIDHIYCSRHIKPGKTTSLKVEFVGPMDKVFPIWLCLDHDGYAKEKALAIVKQFGGKSETVDQAWHEWPHWKQVSRIRVVPTGKFFNVTGIEFKPGQSMQQGLEVEDGQ